jgi:gamma-polyglutamate biosynthesis protein CapA
MKDLAFYGIIIAVVAVLFGHQFFHGKHTHVHFEGGVKAVEVPQPVSLLAFGDVMLDRQVRRFINQNNNDYPFRLIKNVFPGNDIIFANLEGSVTNNPSKTLDLKGKVLHFTFDPVMMQVLRTFGFNVVSLANNHAYDFLRDGYLETQEHLKTADIAYFGDPYNKENLSVIQEVKGMKIGFVGYHEFYTASTTSVVAEIARIRPEADIVIVAPHWGVEYATKHSKAQTAKAHEFIDAGADIVLGAHPHVVQPIEIYNGKPIFYSLGNFIFDQDFSYNTTHGLGVRMVFDSIQDTETIKVNVELIPITIRKTQAALAPESDKAKMLADLAKTAVAPEEIKKGIGEGKFDLTI